MDILPLLLLEGLELMRLLLRLCGVWTCGDFFLGRLADGSVVDPSSGPGPLPGVPILGVLFGLTPEPSVSVARLKLPYPPLDVWDGLVVLGCLHELR